MNSCIFDNFDFDSRHLSFDTIVTFHGIDPISRNQYDHDNTIFHWNIEFSEDLEYNSNDIRTMLCEYIRQASLKKRFDNLQINLIYTTEKYEYENGTDYLMLNSGGIDASSIYMSVKDKLDKRLHTVEIIHTYDKLALENCTNFDYVNKPIVITFTEEHNLKTIISNPCNSKYLRHLCYRKYNIKQTLYGDTSPTYQINYNTYSTPDMINFAFYENQAVSNLIVYKMCGFEKTTKILMNNYWPKVIRKMIFLLIWLNQVDDPHYIDAYNMLDRYIQERTYIKNKYIDTDLHAINNIIPTLKHEYQWYLNKLFDIENIDNFEHECVSFGIREDIFNSYFQHLSPRCDELRDILLDKYHSIDMQFV